MAQAPGLFDGGAGIVALERRDQVRRVAFEPAEALARRGGEQDRKATRARWRRRRSKS